MESHFERVLAADADADAAPKRAAASPPAAPAAKRLRVSGADISALVDGAEAQEGDALDARALKSMANALQKRVRRNALAREKHAAEPSKFLESELALDAEVARWRQLAAKPELFAAMTELQVPRALLGLLGHANLDVRLAVLGLLAELTDVDDAAESLEPAAQLAAHLVDEKLLPLLVANLYELAAAADASEAADEEAAGIYHSLQILENLADLRPPVGAEVAEHTAVLPFLLQQLGPRKGFSQNKLYASEILGQERPKEEKREGKDKDKKVDLMDDLLQALAPYRKRDPATDEEEELVGNLVNALCSVLLVPEAQKQFRRLEGLELLLRFVKDRQRFVFGGALRVMDHALMGNARNCERLIEIGGLRSVFSVFMGRLGKYKLASATKASKASDRAKEEENAVSLVTSMCAWVGEKAPADGYDRLHAKFVENELEKVDRLVDLFAKYHERVGHSNTDDDEDEDEDSRYLRRLDAGLFVLERIAFVVAHLCRFSKKLKAYVMIKFHERSIESNSLTTILREQLDLFKSEEKDDDEVDEARQSQKAQLRALLETLRAEAAPCEDADESKRENGDKTGNAEPESSSC
ncbi:beta-catenin-like protein [Phytophthora cinnamomi]|uniref:beta-catenin-like protein n=1 Tax=Phytophthora cinnamomi TaxID=4785 RepID=UPI00355A2A16|nr:beta-catenin-like protein [Phytophthora cinnamomi]